MPDLKREIELCRQLGVFYVDMQSQPESKAEGFEDTASSDTLLLLHGFPSSSADFSGSILDALSKKFGRVIAFDYPGIALSFFDSKGGMRRSQDVDVLPAGIQSCAPAGVLNKKCGQGMVSATSPGAWSHHPTQFTLTLMWPSSS